MTRAKGLLLVLIGAGVLWLTLLAFCPAAKQNQIFPTVLDLFGDFDIPRTCALADDPYRAETIPAKDRCYAPIGYALERLFPSSADVGGLLFTSVGAALFLLAVGLLWGDGRPDGWLVIGAVAASFPFLLAVERSNQIWLAVAGVVLFLAWFESTTPWKRQTAIFALAFAGALKLSPGIFALLLVKKRRWADLGILAFEGAVLLFAPVLLFNGDNLIGEWMGCMRCHLESYGGKKLIGMERLYPSISFWLAGGCWKETLMALGRFSDVALGVGSVVGFFVCKDRARETLLLAGALLLLPSVSQPYTYLYMVAPFVLAVKRPMSLVEAGLWFLLLCPLTVPVHSYGLNNWLENVAFLLLLAHAAFMQKRDGSPA